MKDGLLHFDCPRCGETLAVGCHIISEFQKPTRQAFGTRYGHFVEFVAETPHLHAEFWGHMVRCHQPHPHPYMPAVAGEQQ